MESLTNFKAKQVQNGWIVTTNAEIGCMGPEYVFCTLTDLAEWLKVQVHKDPL